MKVHCLALVDFRNYSHAEFSPASGPNMLLGANGAGKTNVLEALHLVATGFSYRAGRDVEMISWGKQAFAVRADVELDTFPQDVVGCQVTYAPGRGKTVRRAGKALTGKARTAALGGAVVFSPDDLALVKGSPGGRRTYLDLICAKENPRARTIARRYELALAHRNRLLAEMKGETGAGRGRAAVLAPWTAQLIELGAEILDHRLAVLAAVSGLAREAYCALGGPEVLGIGYQSAIFRTAGWTPDTDEAPAASLEAGAGAAVPVMDTSPADRSTNGLGRSAVARLLAHAFEARRRDEISRGVTLVGPHRDDLDLSLDGNAARVFASQGQQRTVALALRLAEVEYIRRETGEEPILLLDDVFSELDPLRRGALVSLIGGAGAARRQTFVAVTDTSGLPAPGFRPAAVFTIHGGAIHRGG